MANQYKNIYVYWNQYAIEDYRNKLHNGHDIEINTNYISQNDKLHDLLDDYGSDKASIRIYCDIKLELDKAITKKKIYPNSLCHAVVEKIIKNAACVDDLILTLIFLRSIVTINEGQTND